MKTIWVVIISVVVSGALVGGGTYYFLNKQATTDKDALQAQINDLNVKITAAEKALADAQGTTPTGATTGWNTYTNSVYGFNLEYPTGWTKTTDNLPAASVAEGNINNNLVFTGTNNKSLTIWVNPPGFGLENASDFYRAAIANGKISVTSKEKNADSTIGEATIGAMTSQTGIRYTIMYNFNPSDSVAALQEFDTILASFQFTK